MPATTRRSPPLPQGRPLIAPSILSADFARLGAEIDEVLAAGADLLHLDVMDGHFVPNLSFGPPVVAAVRRHVGPGVFLDAHLMISDPLRYAGAMVTAGADLVTFHVETVRDPVDAARRIGELGCRVGITLNPATPSDAVFAALDHVDLVLVMSVVPGFSGQAFMPQALDKARAIRPRLRGDQRLEMDGGLNPATIASAADAGVDWFVVASAVFDRPDRGAAMADLRGRLSGAARD